MSGGVDSSVAAALVARSGSRAVGLTMKLWDCSDVAALPPGASPCCSPADAADAARAARRVAMEHVLVDMREDFRRLVLEPFCRDYAAGRTPNPCVRCNRLLKFGALADRAAAAGYAAIATGHYARRGPDEESGLAVLRRGASRSRDQSYFLAALAQPQLARARLPVGDMDKDAVRRLAAEMGLSAADKPASQEFCFAPDGNYDRVLARHAPEALEPGPLLDSSGKRLGRHRGIGRYTIGQRHGLGVAAGRPLYVNRIEAADRSVVVGDESELYSRGLAASEVNWIPREPAGPVTCTARVRHGGREVAAVVRPLPGCRAEVSFADPVRAVAPGQFVAFYSGEAVLGGGVIERSLGATP